MPPLKSDDSRRNRSGNDIKVAGNSGRNGNSNGKTTLTAESLPGTLNHEQLVESFKLMLLARRLDG